MGFNAAKVMPQLDWDFTAYDGGNGITPEPSMAQIDTFRLKLAALVNLPNEVGDDLAPARKRGTKAAPKKVPLAEAMDRLMSLSGDTPEGVAVREQAAAIYAEVCSDSPNAEQILTLPARVLAAFCGYISEQFLDPKSWTAATTLSRPLALVSSNGTGPAAS